MSALAKKASKLKASLSCFLDNEILFYALAVLLFLLIYVEMVNGYITTHDEMLTIYQIAKGDYFLNQINGYLQSLRGLFIVDAFLQYPQCLYLSEEIYRLFDIAAIAVSVFFAYRFFLTILNKKFARLFVVGFLACVTLSLYDHNAFLAFGFTYKIKIGFAFLLLNIVLKYAMTLEKKYLVVSVVMYVILSAWYESFVLMCVPIALIILFYFQANGNLTPKKVLKVVLAFSIPEAIYVLLYIWASSHVGFSYEGTEVSPSIAPAEFFRTVFTFMVGDMPFARRILTNREVLERVMQLSPETVLFWAKGIILAGLAARYAYTNNQVGGKQLAFVIVLCIASAFSLCIPFGLTSKYVSWVAEYDVHGYGVSYYSYYFLIAAMMAVAALAAVIARRHSKIVLWLVTGTLFAMTLALSLYTDVNNQANIDIMQKQEEKSDAFIGIMNANFMDEIPDGSLIYTTDYMGIHTNIDTLSSLTNMWNGRDFDFTNQLNTGEDTTFYWLRYDEEMQLATLTKYVSGEVGGIYFHSNQNISNMSGELHLPEGSSPTYCLNGIDLQSIDQTAVFSLGYNNSTPNDASLLAEEIDSVVIGSCVLAPS